MQSIFSEMMLIILRISGFFVTQKTKNMHISLCCKLPVVTSLLGSSVMQQGVILSPELDQNTRATRVNAPEDRQ